MTCRRRGIQRGDGLASGLVRRLGSAGPVPVEVAQSCGLGHTRCAPVLAASPLRTRSCRRCFFVMRVGVRRAFDFGGSVVARVLYQREIRGPENGPLPRPIFRPSFRPRKGEAQLLGITLPWPKSGPGNGTVFGPASRSAPVGVVWRTVGRGARLGTAGAWPGAASRAPWPSRILWRGFLGGRPAVPADTAAAMAIAAVGSAR